MVEHLAGECWDHVSTLYTAQVYKSTRLNQKQLRNQWS
jgi:hypothetical protein